MLNELETILKRKNTPENSQIRGILELSNCFQRLGARWRDWLDGFFALGLILVLIKNRYLRDFKK